MSSHACGGLGTVHFSVGRRTRPLPLSQYSHAQSRSLHLTLFIFPRPRHLFPIPYIRFPISRLQAFTAATPPTRGPQQPSNMFTLSLPTVKSSLDSRDNVRERRTSISITASADRSGATSGRSSKRASHTRTFAFLIYTFTNTNGRLEHFRIPPQRATVPRFHFDYSELGRRRPNGASRPASSPPQRGFPHIIRRLWIVSRVPHNVYKSRDNVRVGTRRSFGKIDTGADKSTST